MTRQWTSSRSTSTRAMFVARQIQHIREGEQQRWRRQHDFQILDDNVCFLQWSVEHLMSSNTLDDKEGINVGA